MESITPKKKKKKKKKKKEKSKDKAKKKKRKEKEKRGEGGETRRQEKRTWAESLYILLGGWMRTQSTKPKNEPPDRHCYQAEKGKKE